MVESIEENMYLILEKLVEISKGYPSERPFVGREKLLAMKLTTIQLKDAIYILEYKKLVGVDRSFGAGYFKVKLTAKGKLEFERMQNEKALLKNQEKEDIMKTTSTSKDKAWDKIEKEYDINKIAFGKKIVFVKPKDKRDIIFRDVGHAYILANTDFFKPAVILAGGVIEELLRLYLKHKKIKPPSNTFNSYIKTCEENGLLKSAIRSLTDSFRDFRNIVHLEKEETPRDAISKATAKGAVSSIFSLANDFH